MIIFIVALLRPAHALITVSGGGIEATNTSPFLLEVEASDPAPAAYREAVEAVVGVQLANPSILAPEDIELEATFSLVGQSDGLPVPLQTDPAGPSLVVTQTFTVPPSSPASTALLSAALRPALRLDLGGSYRVEASLRTRPPGGSWSAPVLYSGVWRKWVHFINTLADDSSLNVEALTGALVVTDRESKRLVPGQEMFAATLGMTLHRYDLETTPQAAALVPVTFALRLLKTGTSVEVVRLANPTITVERSLAAQTVSSPPDPVTDTWTQALTFAPAEGEVLDPTADYQLEVTVSVAEPDSSLRPAVPPLVTSTAARYLALSGRLWFGGVETWFTQLGNDPSFSMALDTGVGVFRTELAVAAQSGSAAAAPGRHYGDGAALPVTYDPVSGDATFTGSGTQAFSTSASDVVMLGGLRFVRGPMRLSATGAALDSGGVFFPAGFGVSTTQNSRRHQPGLSFVNITLNNNFSLPFTTKPVTPPPGQYFYAFCDRLPLRFRTSEIVWRVDAGTFEFNQVPTSDPADPAGPVLVRQFQEAELAALTPLLADTSAATRPSNDAYLRNITSQSPIVVSVGPSGQALLDVQFDLGAGQLVTHFPQGVNLDWAVGRFTLVKSAITNPSYLTAANPITVSYKRDCDGLCGATSGPGQLSFLPTGYAWGITADGGLTAAGSISPERLRWGTTALLGGASPPEGGPAYAHQTNQWTAGAFHAAGTWLAGVEAQEVAEVERAQSVLLSGVLADGTYERPRSVGYRAGLADYAGLNLRVGTAGAKNGRSVLAGRIVPDSAFPPYDLKARSKYYVRAGGVTGIHEAVSLNPTSLFMYDFRVEVDGLRLAFLDGANVESQTGGSLRVNDPVTPALGFNLDFKNLAFSCNGLPGKLQLANEGETKTLAYWGTDIIPLSVEFVGPIPATGCPSVDAGGFLLVGVETRFPSVTPQKLHAVLGFLPNGNLVTQASPLAAGRDVDSRFVLPPNLTLVGVGDLPWEVTVAGRAYLNNPDPGHPAPYLPRPDQFQRPAQGFLTFPATLNVPWFEDVKIQLQVSASSTANAATSLIQVMGGWAANPADGHGTGWQIGGQTYFTNKYFDPDHLGFPAGLALADYRNSGLTNNDFKPRAQKRWLGVVDFDFPLVWDATQRRFRSGKQEGELLVLANVNRQVQSLTPSTAELTFGVSLEIPRLNTQSLSAAVKEGVSGVVADALNPAIFGAIKAQLGGGLTQLDSLLSQRLDPALAVPLAAASDPVADAILAGNPALASFPTLQADLTTLPALGLTDAVNARLTAGLGAVDAGLALVAADGSGNRNLVRNLVFELLNRSGVPGADTLDLAAVNAALAQILPKIEPDLAQAEQVLWRARAALLVGQARLGTQVPAVFQEPAAVAALSAVANLALIDVANAQAGNGWTVLSPAVKRARIQRLISERVLASAVVPKLQYVVRQNIQDTNEVFRAALDDVLGQVNHLVREVIKVAITEGSAQLTAALATTRSPAVGDLGPASGGSGKLAALNIEGYAQINDESLQELSINGRFEFNVPDSLQVQAHLHIKQYTADTPPAGCRLGRGATVAVVTVGAQAACDWIGTAGTIVGVDAKFALLGGNPVGFDGSFHFKGEVSVGPVTVQEILLTAGFGTTGTPASTWAYVGGKARGLYGGYEAAAGIFLGRTCNVEILSMVDSTVGLALTEADVDTNAPITGVYFYGEAWFPLNEVFGIPSSCLLTLKAGGGSGYFAFIGQKAGADTVFIGCKQAYGVEGTVLCALSARGSMTLFGAVALPTDDLPLIGANARDDGLFSLASNIADTLYDGTYVIHGEGAFSVKFGLCPACIKASRSIGLTWTMQPPKASLGVSF